MTAEAYLSELQEKQVALAYQKKKLANQERFLSENETALERQRDVLKKEERDVDNLGKLSAASIFNTLTGRTEKVARKEEEEYLAAKLRFEELQNAVSKTRADKNRLAADTTMLQNDYERLKEEARRLYPQIDSHFTDIERQKSALRLKIRELDEAMAAGEDVTETIEAAIHKLEKARGWATYDMFARGGLISHMAKYGNIDDAQEMMHALGFYMDNFKTELRDTEISFDGAMHEYSEGSRLFDYFFDNIFTDMRIRGEIDDDIASLASLCDQIEGVKKQIAAAKTATLQQLQALEIH